MSVKTYHHNLLTMSVHWLVFYTAVHAAIWIAGFHISPRGEIAFAVGIAALLGMQARRILSVGKAEDQLRASLEQERSSVPFDFESKREPFFPGHVIGVALLLIGAGIATRFLR